jgi:hypothetical protein
MTNNAFVLMPFKEPFNGYYKHIFVPALRDAGYAATRADDIYQPGAIMTQISRALREAKLILCDLSERNPNVFYELGLAHSRGKPVILVSSERDEIPFDLRALRVILYDTKLAGWEAKLRKEIRQQATGVNITNQDMILDDLIAAPMPSPGDEEWKQAYAYYAARYGWGYDELRVSCRIESDGSVVVERELTVTAHRLLKELEQSLHVSPATPDDPVLDPDQIDFLSKSPGTEVHCKKIFRLPNEKGWVVQVSIDPPVPPGHTVTFRERERLGKNTFEINYTAEQLAAKHIKYQWLNWRIDRPTLHFHATVRLPAGFQPVGSSHRVLFPPLPDDPDDARRLEDEEDRHKLLTTRFTDSTGEHYELELDVSLPILGMQYMIRWDPLNNTK